jgi:isocitrate dehydrogenase kinase/phosphatase
VCEAHRSGEAFRRPWHAEPDCQVQVLSSLFFRNKGAYIVGRLINGTRITPIAVPLLRNANGHLYIDTAIFTTDLLSTLFSFTRAYFLVDMEAPSAYVDFLRTHPAVKPASELYTMVGLPSRARRSSTATSCTTCGTRTTSSSSRPASRAS